MKMHSGFWLKVGMDTGSELIEEIIFLAAETLAVIDIELLAPCWVNCSRFISSDL